jgi:hypothetical protein
MILIFIHYKVVKQQNNDFIFTYQKEIFGSAFERRRVGA